MVVVVAELVAAEMKNGTTTDAWRRGRDLLRDDDGTVVNDADMLPNGAALVNGGDGAVAAGVGPNGG